MKKKLDPRRREARPKLINAGDRTYERNDCAAKRYGQKAKTLDKKDRQGAPFVLIAGVKYRPLPDFDDYMATGIRRLRPPEPVR